MIWFLLPAFFFLVTRPAQASRLLFAVRAVNLLGERLPPVSSTSSPTTFLSSFPFCSSPLEFLPFVTDLQVAADDPPLHCPFLDTGSSAFPTHFLTLGSPLRKKHFLSSVLGSPEGSFVLFSFFSPTSQDPTSPPTVAASPPVRGCVEPLLCS